MSRCVECRYWTREPKQEPRWGCCTLTDGALMRAEAEPSYDPPAVYAETHETFGCVQFEAKS